MSVTFSMPDAPTKRVRPYPDEPDLWLTEPVPPFTEMNLSNSNARDFLEILGCDTEELCGTWDIAECRRLLTAVNDLLTTDKKAVLLEPTITDSAPGRCTMVYCGRDMDYVNQRLSQFKTMLEVAIAHGYEISYG